MATDEILATCDIIDVEEKVKQLCSNKNLATEFVFSLRDPPLTVNRPNLRTSTVKRKYRILIEQLSDFKLTTEPDDQSRMPWPLDLNIPRPLEKDEDAGAAVWPSS
ncbi:hypothetical protein QQ045_000404 [Rhodiola kirilowii]